MKEAASSLSLVAFSVKVPVPAEAPSHLTLRRVDGQRDGDGEQRGGARWGRRLCLRHLDSCVTRTREPFRVHARRLLAVPFPLVPGVGPRFPLASRRRRTREINTARPTQAFMGTISYLREARVLRFFKNRIKAQVYGMVLGRRPEPP